MASAPPRIFDRRAYRMRRARAGKSGGEPFLPESAALAMAERISAINREFGFALDIGSHRAAFLQVASAARQWVRSGPAAEAFDGRPYVVCDEEYLPFAEESFDLVTSALSLHAVNDLPGTLVQIRKLLKPDGLFLGALFGGESLMELRRSFAVAEAEIADGITPRVSPFADMRDLGGLLQRAGFALPVSDVERTVVRYTSAERLFMDLRAMGETNYLVGRSPGFLSRRLFSEVLARYSSQFSDADGRLRATFEIVYLTGWAPHESQQKPLRPGSAQMRLADILKKR